MRSPRDSRQPWLVLVHQLPAEPSRLRVKVWRRLQAVGAVAIKSSVYVLPNTAESREDFEWIRTEVVAEGGEALVFAAAVVDELSSAELQEVFDRAVTEEWQALAAKAGELLRDHPAAGDDRRDLQRQLRALRARADEIERIDCSGVVGRQEALAVLAELEGLARGGERGSRRPAASKDPAEYRGRVWLTRPRPGIDRMASAWLVRRFVDPDATFRFAERVPPDEDVVPFDMYGVDLSHRGEQVTFEVLLEDFDLHGSALDRIARLVHRVDLKEDGAGEGEAGMLARLVAGLRASYPDDHELLAQGMALFEALYAASR